MKTDAYMLSWYKRRVVGLEREVTALRVENLRLLDQIVAGVAVSDRARLDMILSDALRVPPKVTDG